MKKLGTIPFVIILLSASLLAACGQAAAPNANPAVPTVSGPAAAPLATANPKSAAASSSPINADACALLTKDDVSQAWGTPVDTTVGTGRLDCKYTAKNLSIAFTIGGHTGGIQAMKTTLASLGDLALVVPGLGDQAFYNTNSANALFVLKGDAEFLFSMSDLTYQPQDPAVVKSTEKAVAEQLLSHLQ